MSAIYTLGIDVGSTASKCIMLKDGQEIHLTRTGDVKGLDEIGWY